MQHRIYLPTAEPQCVRSAPCPRSASCARWLVAPSQGRPVRDYSTAVNNWAAATCDGFLAAQDHRTRPPAPERQVKEWAS
jgi:hypothetical protein